MTSLAEIALAFARECLGWEDVLALPEDSEMGEAAVIVRGDTDTAFYYTDLNAVMEAVRGWCDGVRLGFSLSKSHFDTVFEVTVTDGAALAEHAHGPNACHALLAACVEAARKLQAA